MRSLLLYTWVNSDDVDSCSNVRCGWGWGWHLAGSVCCSCCHRIKIHSSSCLLILLRLQQTGGQERGKLSIMRVLLQAAFRPWYTFEVFYLYSAVIESLNRQTKLRDFRESIGNLGNILENGKLLERMWSKVNPKCHGKQRCRVNSHTQPLHFSFVFGRPFVKRFALYCRTVVLSVLSCLWRWCTVAKRLDGSRWNLACR